jgi:hypothetical protein
MNLVIRFFSSVEGVFVVDKTTTIKDCVISRPDVEKESVDVRGSGLETAFVEIDVVEKNNLGRVTNERAK